MKTVLKTHSEVVAATDDWMEEILIVIVLV